MLPPVLSLPCPALRLMSPPLPRPPETNCIDPGAPSVEGPVCRVMSPPLLPTDEPVWMNTLPLSENLEAAVLMNTELLSPLSV